MKLLLVAALAASNAGAHDASVGFEQAALDTRAQLRAAVRTEKDTATAALTAWRASGWGARRPPQMARVREVIAKARREIPEPDRKLGRTSDFLARHGGKLGRMADRDVWIGINPPDNRDNCDDVLIAIAPEEAFC